MEETAANVIDKTLLITSRDSFVIQTLAYEFKNNFKK